MSAGPKHRQQRRGSGKCSCYHSKRIAVALKARNQAIIFIIANIILTFAFIVLIIVWAVVRTPLTIRKESSVCIPCESMKSYGNTNLEPEAAGRSVITQRNDGMCCGPVENIAKILFQKEVAAQDYHRSSSQTLFDIVEEYTDCEKETNDKQTMAKVYGIAMLNSSDSDNGRQYKIIWNKKGQIANNCIHLELEGLFFIRQSGYYIVSSQLNLRRQTVTNSSRNETIITTFIHNIDILSNKVGKTVLLVQTMKSIETNDVYYTSFLSAVFKLNKYDRLSVSVSHPELLDIDNPNDHFLVYYTYDLPN